MNDRHGRSIRILGYVVLGLAAFSVLSVIYLNVQQHKAMTCQNAYINQLHDTLDAQFQVDKQERQALNDLSLSLIGAKTPDQFVTAITHYQETMASLDKIRTTIPDLPTSCDGM